MTIAIEAAALFVERLRKNLESWRAGDMDFSEYNDSQEAIWAEVYNAGHGIETAVIQTLGRGLPSPAAIRRRLVRGRFRAELVTTECRRVVLRIAPRTEAPPDDRRTAAFIYELAADLERRSADLRAQWSIRPRPEERQLVLELMGDDDAVLADTLVSRVIALHGLG